MITTIQSLCHVFGRSLMFVGFFVLVLLGACESVYATYTGGGLGHTLDGVTTNGNTTTNDVTTGTVTIGASGKLRFGDYVSTDDHVRLNATSYGFGVEGGTLYNRAFGQHRWYIAELANSGATENMELDGNSLNFNNKEAIRYSDAWLRLNQAGNFSNGTYTPGLFRSDGGFLTDNKQVISPSGAVHQANYTDATRYGYFAAHNGSAARGMYLGWGNGASTVDLNLDAASILNITGGDVGIGDSTPDGSLVLDVEGQVGATEYCDENGANCRAVTDLSPWTQNGNDLEYIESNGDVRLYSYISNVASKADFELLRARGTVATPANVINADELGALRFYGYNGSAGDYGNTGYENVVGIYARVEGSVTSSVIPSRLSFHVRDAGNVASSPERMVIEGTNGYVGIGTTSPSYLLEVDGTAGKPGGGSWTNSSDARLKDINPDFSYGLTDIMQLDPIWFNYKKDNPRNLPSDQVYAGFVAQDVQEVFPEAVTEGEDGYLDFNMHTVNVSVVKAIQELSGKVDELFERYVSYQSEIDMLREDIASMRNIILIDNSQER